MKKGWKFWLILIGALLAIIGHWVMGYWLDVIGGVLALIGLLFGK